MCEDNAEDSVWLQRDKCNSWTNVYCILRIAEQEVTEKILSCSTEHGSPKIVYRNVKGFICCIVFHE